jgi:hypothetical protein
VVNDFKIPTKNKEIAEQHRGQHFRVAYDLEREVFLIKDLGCGYGVFMRMEEPKLLTNEILFNIGEAYMVINLLQGDADDDQN